VRHAFQGEIKRDETSITRFVEANAVSALERAKARETLAYVGDKNAVSKKRKRQGLTDKLRLPESLRRAVLEPLDPVSCGF
jgi:hypothetical protein